MPIYGNTFARETTLVHGDLDIYLHFQEQTYERYFELMESLPKEIRPFFLNFRDYNAFRNGDFEASTYDFGFNRLHVKKLSAALMTCLNNKEIQANPILDRQLFRMLDLLSKEDSAKRIEKFFNRTLKKNPSFWTFAFPIFVEVGGARITNSFLRYYQKLKQALKGKNCKLSVSTLLQQNTSLSYPQELVPGMINGTVSMIGKTNLAISVGRRPGPVAEQVAVIKMELTPQEGEDT